MRNHYRVSKGTNDGNLAYAWHLTCNNRHVEWFSDEVIARQVCDRLNANELIMAVPNLFTKENKNGGND